MNRPGLAIVPPSANQLAAGARFLDRIEQVKALRAQEAAAAAPVHTHTTTLVPPQDTATGTAETVPPPARFSEPKPLDPTLVLSPSSVNQFVHDCQVKWFYRRVLELPETRGAALGLGSAIHAAIGENYRQKRDTREDLPTPGVVALFHTALTEELDTVTLDKTDNVADLREVGEVMTKVYMEQCAPRIQPAAIERHVVGKIGGVAVQGFIDVLDTDGNIIDLKTASKKPSGVNTGYRVQVATYTMLEPAASGRARLDTLTKTKTVGLHQQTIDVSTADRLQATRLYAIAQEQMRAGVFIPNRGSHLCNRKYCSYWSRCQDEYGGEVA